MRNADEQFGTSDIGLFLFVATAMWLLVTQGLLR
jgi:hypothetical protein